MSSFRLDDVAGPMAPSTSDPSDRGRPLGDDPTNGSPDRVSETGPWVGDVSSEYAIPIPPPELPPDSVVDAFRPDEPTAVVPHPRYPDEPSSRISNGPSWPAAPPLTTPTVGNVGSSLGL
jgi:hypothetical protein